MAQATRYNLSAEEVQAWFNANPAPVIKETYEDNVTCFVGKRSTLSVEVVYEDDCPTCGGAYVKQWNLEETV